MWGVQTYTFPRGNEFISASWEPLGANKSFSLAKYLAESFSVDRF